MELNNIASGAASRFETFHQTLPIVIRRPFKVIKNKKKKKDTSVLKVSKSRFNLTGVCWTVCGLTYTTTCSTVHIHIHSFHKKYIFVYTAFTLSYNRAVTGSSGCSRFLVFFKFATKESSRVQRFPRPPARPPGRAPSPPPPPLCSLERTRVGFILAISLDSLLLSQLPCLSGFWGPVGTGSARRTRSPLCLVLVTASGHFLSTRRPASR